MGESKNLWGGRFTGEADEEFAAFNRSFGFDRRLFEADVRASLAHAEALSRAGVLSASERDQIRAGLETMLEGFRLRGAAYFDGATFEDVHSFIEARLNETIGEAALKLHTGRSRNDQVATALRLWLREEIDHIARSLRQTQAALLDAAEAHRDAIIPGYTHLQRAQPILWAHWCLAYFEMLARDRARLTDARRRVNVMPLGSAALSGTSFEIDREEVARELGFEEAARNSLDAVSDRDFCIEFSSVASLIMLHLSRLAEDIIIYASVEFGFIELTDAVTTGSSLLPQKKNPDSMELVRGKAGRVFGHNMALLAMMKGLPLAYNKDMQEDKEAIFDTVDTVGAALEVTAKVLRNLRVREAKTRAEASRGYLNATELADYLARKGVLFREAHDAVGRLVLLAIERERELHELSLEEMRTVSSLVEDDVYTALTLENSLATKSQTGGTAPARVAEALARARSSLMKP